MIYVKCNSRGHIDWYLNIPYSICGICVNVSQDFKKMNYVSKLYGHFVYWYDFN